jgi:hypothetical protein
MQWPTGQRLEAASNRLWDDLTRDLTGAYIGPFHKHANVHLWYHGTCNTETGAYDGEKYVTQSIRNDTGWYLPEEDKGKKTGYYFSRILGGTYTNCNQRPHAGTLHGNLFREPWLIQAQGNETWPNIEIYNLTSREPVQQGNSFQVQAIFFDKDNDATITFGLDQNRNPYDGFYGSALRTRTTASISGVVSQPRHFTETLSSSGFSPGEYYVYAKITRGTRTRYYYSHSPIEITAAPVQQYPDFVVESVTLTPSSPAVGSLVSATVVVKNQGTIAGDAGYLDVWYHRPTAVPDPSDGGYDDYVSVGNLNSGQTKSYVFEFIAPGPVGNKTFRAFVDSENSTPESSRTGNQIAQVYTVRDVSNVDTITLTYDAHADRLLLEWPSVSGAIQYHIRMRPSPVGQTAILNQTVPGHQTSYEWTDFVKAYGHRGPLYCDMIVEASQPGGGWIGYVHGYAEVFIPWSVSGRVYCAATGQGVSGVRVNFHGAKWAVWGDPWWDSEDGTTTTDLEGNYLWFAPSSWYGSSSKKGAMTFSSC